MIIDIWSDIHCPWALITVHRLRQARRELGADVVFRPRAWPLEWVNGHGTPRAIVVTETAALASHEPDLFSAYTNDSWPSTFLPAFELVAAARRTHGERAAEDVDHALRLTFFRDAVDVSVLDGLKQALTVAVDNGAEIDPESVLATWRSGEARRDVAADHTASLTLPIQGSPQVFWPDGTTTHNPGMTDHDWERGLVRIRATDRDAAKNLLIAATDCTTSS